MLAVRSQENSFEFFELEEDDIRRLNLHKKIECTNNVNSWFFRHVALYSTAALKCVLATVSKLPRQSPNIAGLE